MHKRIKLITIFYISCFYLISLHMLAQNLYFILQIITSFKNIRERFIQLSII